MCEIDQAEGWEEVGPGTPVGVTLETWRKGETGTNRCFCRILAIGDEPEWVEEPREDHTGTPVSGRTTVTHSTFLPPTHWRWLRD